MNVNSINEGGKQFSDMFDRTEFLMLVQSWLSKYAKLYEGLGAFAGVGLGLQAFREAYGMLKTFNQHFAYEAPSQKKEWSLYAETANVTFDYLDVGDFFLYEERQEWGRRLGFKSGKDSIKWVTGSRGDITSVNIHDTKVRRVQVSGFEK